MIAVVVVTIVVSAVAVVPRSIQCCYVSLQHNVFLLVLVRLLLLFFNFSFLCSCCCFRYEMVKIQKKVEFIQYCYVTLMWMGPGRLTGGRTVDQGPRQMGLADRRLLYSVARLQCSLLPVRPFSFSGGATLFRTGRQWMEPFSRYPRLHVTIRTGELSNYLTNWGIGCA